MINVEQAALGAFEHDAFARFAQVIELPADIGHQVREVITQFQGLLEYPVKGNSFLSKALLEYKVVIIEDVANFFGQYGLVEQIGCAQAAPRHLVFIRRADTPAGGAYGTVTACFFARPIQQFMVRHDNGAGWRDPQTRAHIHAFLLQLLDFLPQGLQRQHHSIANQALNAGLQYACRDQVEDRFFAIDDQRVAGIVPALETDNGVCVTTQEIDDFALTLVSPLGAQNDDAVIHLIFPDFNVGTAAIKHRRACSRCRRCG